MSTAILNPVHTLVVLIGRQLSPALISVQHWQPKHLILVHTSDTKSKANKLQKALVEIEIKSKNSFRGMHYAQHFCPDTIQKYEVASGYQFGWFDALKKTMNIEPHTTLLDITGGTKVMSLELAQKQDFQRTYYVPTEEPRFLILGADDTTIGVDLNLHWHYPVHLAGLWSGEEPSLTETDARVAALILAGLRQPYAKKIYTRIIKAKKPTSRIPLGTEDGMLAWLQEAQKLKIVALNDGVWTTNYLNWPKERIKVVKGRYLEELTFLALQQLEAEGTINFPAGNILIKRTENDKHIDTELDAICTFNNSPVFLSCKSGTISEAMGGANQLKSLADTLGGSRAHGILIYNGQAAEEARLRNQMKDLLPNLGLICWQTDIATTHYSAVELAALLAKKLQHAKPIGDI